MRVLVTGGAGYIGSHVLVELLTAGHNVHVIDDLSRGHATALRRVEALTGREIPLTVADIRDFSKVYDTLARCQPEACIHLAGVKSPAESLQDPDLYRSINVDGSRVLFEALDRVGCRSIVFSSSAAVYGPPDYLPVDESHPTRPATPYGASKLAVERDLLEAGDADPGKSLAILRYFNPIGAHASALIGEHPSGSPANIMPILLEVAQGRRPQVMVYGTDYDTPDGTGLRDYLHITDLARAHLAALRWTTEHTGARVFNLGTGRGVSVREIIETFSQTTGLTLPVMDAPRREGDVSANFADPGRANRELGWKTELSLEQACSSAQAWSLKNPDGYSRD